ncbi:MMPL family transporter [Nocardioides sp.]|uniref:MMPL family transporter n=1 Tax=Nocardioides sp. TaxID=35761 RepID=UPI0027374A17|nr:MMPL family transporter [Nocardioides sp.]MDP3891716.1 MMPL family transporter [Nocardioides sp.]
MLERLGRWVHRRSAGILAGWLALALAGAVLGGSVFDRAESPGPRAGVESTLVEQRLDRVDPGGEQVVAVLRGTDALGVALVGQASQVLHDLRALPGVHEIRDPYTTGASDLLADDGRGAVVQVELDPSLDHDEALHAADEVAMRLRTIAFPSVVVGGELLAEEAFAQQAVRDAARGEGVALVVLFGVLVAVLGGWLVGALPVLTALGAIAASLLCLTGLATVTSVSEYAVNVVTLLGLALTIDYSLLVLARFREERATAGRKADPARVLGRTMATAGHTVLISGLTVGAALSGLLVLGDPVLTGMAIGGVVAVAVATAAGLTLAPAMITLGHARIPALGAARGPRRPRSPADSILARSAGLAQRRPWPVLLGSAGLLVVLATPLLALQVGDSDARSLPATSEPRLAYDAVQQHHAGLRTTPITLLTDPPPADPQVSALAQQLTQLEDVADVVVLDALPDGSTKLAVEPVGATFGPAALRLIGQLRELDLAVPVRVGGPAAELVDARAAIGQRLPLAVALVMLVTGALLLVLTGSLVVPVKALALNLLSLAATLGVVVTIFQWGWGSSLLGFTPWGALDLTTPLLLFLFAFGLSMDYHVFLVARIKEFWDAAPRGRGGSAAGSRAANDRAVLAGITASGPVVTLAALAISIVFLGFAAGELVAVKEIGVGMTVAILIDVTVVRGLLLPAVMTLLGRWNWWLPGGSVRGRRRTPRPSPAVTVGSA